MSHAAAMPIATDPLGAIRMELVAAARRRTATRHRHQRVSTAAATGAATLVAVAGASAITGVGTGIQAIDELLGTVTSHQPVRLGWGGAIRSGSIAPADSQSTSPPLAVPWGDGSHNADAVAYLTRSGTICIAVARPSGEGVSEAVGVGSCMLPATLSTRLADDAVLVMGTFVGDTAVIVHGYVAEDVESIEVRGPDGPLDVQLTDSWTPDAPGAEPLRVFAAVGRFDSGADGLHADEADRVMNPRKYTWRAEFRDGRIVEIKR